MFSSSLAACAFMACVATAIARFYQDAGGYPSNIATAMSGQGMAGGMSGGSHSGTEMRIPANSGFPIAYQPSCATGYQSGYPIGYSTGYPSGYSAYPPTMGMVAGPLGHHLGGNSNAATNTNVNSNGGWYRRSFSSPNRRADSGNPDSTGCNSCASNNGFVGTIESAILGAAESLPFVGHSSDA